MAPAMSITENMFLGREVRKSSLMGRWLRMLDTRRMLADATGYMKDLQIGIHSMKQPVEALSGGQRPGVAVARSAAFARHVGGVRPHPHPAAGQACCGDESARDQDVGRCRHHDRGPEGDRGGEERVNEDV